MGVWDFVIGILIGIVMACVSLVVSASRKSPIRVTYSGVVARSTVRRPPTQQHFLREIGRQTQVVKLAGYMFFGTIASVERWVRDLLEEQNFHEAPIRYLIVDFRHVTGLDFSAAEAFTRMRRLLSVRNVQMIISGVDSSSEVGQGLRSVGVWAETDVIQVFEDLNLALESCENEFLSALYSQNEGQTPKQSNASHLGWWQVPLYITSLISQMYQVLLKPQERLVVLTAHHGARWSIGLPLPPLSKKQHIPQNGKIFDGHYH